MLSEEDMADEDGLADVEEDTRQVTYLKSWGFVIDCCVLLDYRLIIELR